MTKRIAQIFAVTIEVHCPHCGDAQPSPVDGSHIWLPSQVLTNEGKRTCVACDEEFTLIPQSRAQVSP